LFGGLAGVEVKKSAPAVESTSKVLGLFLMEDAPGKRFCCAIMTPMLGQKRFCCAPVSDGSACAVRTHRNKQKAEVLEDYLYVRSPRTGSREGATAFVARAIPILKVPSAFVSRYEEPVFTLGEWDDKFHEWSVEGSEEDAKTPAKKLRFGETLEKVFTPKVQRFVTGGAKLSPSDSESSWVLPEGLQLEELAGNVDAFVSEDARSPAMQRCKTVVQKLVANVDELGRYTRAAQERMQGLYEDLYSKMNSLSVSNDEFERAIGERGDFDHETGASSIYEGLHYLKSKVDDQGPEAPGATRLDESRIKQLEDSLATVTKESFSSIGELESRIRDLIKKADKSKAETKKLSDTVTELGSTLDVSLRTLNHDFVAPLRERWASMTQPGPANPLDGFNLGNASGSDSLQTRELKLANDRLQARLDDLENYSYRRKEIPETVADDISNLTRRLTALEGLEEGSITVGTCTFRNVNDCVDFLRKHVGEDNLSNIILADFMSLCHGAYSDEAASVESIMTRDHHAARGGFGNISLVEVYSSMQQPRPKPFSGTKSHPLPGIAKFDDWDHQDGIGGKRRDLTDAIESKVSGLRAVVRAEFSRQPITAMVFNDLLTDSLVHWKVVAEFLSTKYNECLRQGATKEESWLFPCEIVLGLFKELDKVRTEGRTRSDNKRLTLGDAGRLMWGILRSHQLMKEIVHNGLTGHSALATYSITHLFRHRLTPADLQAEKKRSDELEKEVKALKSQLNRIKGPVNKKE